MIRIAYKAEGKNILVGSPGQMVLDGDSQELYRELLRLMIKYGFTKLTVTAEGTDAPAKP